MTTIYFATVGAGDAFLSLKSLAGAPVPPAILVSFAYLKNFKKEELVGHRLMLDSGAFTAHMRGKKIDIKALCQEASSPMWHEVAALDVISDPEKSLANAVLMKAHRPDVMPTFHYGEPWEFLVEYAKSFGKVGIGGLARLRSGDRLPFIEECFARAYPAKFHLFGWVQEDVLARFPFHSADSTGWEMKAAAFGKYAFAKGQHLGINRTKARAAAGTSFFRPEIQHFLRMQGRIRARWKGEFDKQGWS